MQVKNRSNKQKNANKSQNKQENDTKKVQPTNKDFWNACTMKFGETRDIESMGLWFPFSCTCALFKQCNYRLFLMKPVHLHRREVRACQLLIVCRTKSEAIIWPIKNHPSKGQTSNDFSLCLGIWTDFPESWLLENPQPCMHIRSENKILQEEKYMNTLYTTSNYSTFSEPTLMLF